MRGLFVCVGTQISKIARKGKGFESYAFWKSDRTGSACLPDQLAPPDVSVGFLYRLVVAVEPNIAPIGAKVILKLGNVADRIR